MKKHSVTMFSFLSHYYIKIWLGIFCFVFLAFFLGIEGWAVPS